MLSFIDHTPVGLPHTPCELRRFAAALRASLRFRSARGAICALSLTSELVDSLRLIIIKRQARRSGYARDDKRSHHGIWNFHRKYAKRGRNADGKGVLNAKLNKKLSLISRTMSEQGTTVFCPISIQFSSKMCCPYYYTRMRL